MKKKQGLEDQLLYAQKQPLNGGKSSASVHQLLKKLKRHYSAGKIIGIKIICKLLRISRYRAQCFLHWAVVNGKIAPTGSNSSAKYLILDAKPLSHEWGQAVDYFLYITP